MACTERHALYCFEVLNAELAGKSTPAYEGDDGEEEYPLFVTWNTVRPGGSTRLRGCIGSFTPLPLLSGLSEYALIAALKDRRFTPIASSELPKLECGVSLLTDFEDVSDPFDWTLGEHGIYIHFEDPASSLAPPPPPVDSPASASSASTTASGSSSTDDPSTLKNKLVGLGSAAKKRVVGHRSSRATMSATYLPDVAPAQGWSKVETLDSAMRKAGYSGKITDAIRKSVRVTRYRSSKASVTYQEWLQASQASS